MTSASDDNPERPEPEDLFGADTLQRDVEMADVLGRMFGDGHDEPVRTLGRYDVVQQVGEGGMGVVYLGRDRELDRNVALKLLSPQTGDTEAEVVENRVRGEARAMARLIHPNVVQVFEVARHENRLFLAMEYVDGQTLGQWLRAQQRSWAEILRAFLQAGEGLSAVNEAGLVHRDFKPDNVLVAHDEAVKVTDFGIARIGEAASGTSPAGQKLTEGEATQRGAGTLLYMSPEQMNGLDVDARTDQYAFCVALYEALLGEHPFGSGNATTFMMAVTEGERKPLPAGSSVPRWVLEPILRGLALEPDDRWPSMRPLLDALQRDPAVRRRLLLAGGAIAVVAAGVAFAVGRGAAPAQEDPCLEGAELAERSWNTARREAVAVQLASLELPFADASLSAVSQALDAWRDQWSAQYSELCRGRHGHSDQRYDLRMACLSHQRSQVDAFATLLGTSDPQLAAELPLVANRLPDPSECTLARAFGQLMPPPVASADVVAEVREGLAEIEARILAGQRDVGGDLATLRGRADAAGYAPLTAEIALLQSKVSMAGSAVDDALEYALRAHELALESRHDRVALAAAINLVSVEARGAPTPATEQGREHWNRIAEGLSKRLGNPPRLEISRRTSHMEALRSHGRAEAIDAESQAAMGFVDRTIGFDDPRAAPVLELRAWALFAGVKPDEAMAMLDRADALSLKSVGLDHPARLTLLTTRGGMLMSFGRIDEAAAVTRTEYEIVKQAYGGTPRFRRTIARLGMMEDMRGRYTEARALYIEALGTDHPRADRLDMGEAHIANSLCFTLYKMGEHGAAVDVCDAALRAAERLFPDGHGLQAIILNNLGLVARAQGDPETGLGYDRRALAIADALEPPDTRTAAYALVGIGEGLLALRRGAEAVDSLRRAVAIRTKAKAGPEVSEAQCLLAQALGDGEEATELARSAVASLKAAGPPFARQAAACQAWLDR